jgi:hypothetical protein
MKKTVLFLCMLVTPLTICLAQSTTNATPSVVLHGSYQAISDILVNPYIEQNSDNTPDQTIHFRIKKGDKFYVDKVINSGTSVTGYMVRVWDYHDYKKYMGVKSPKKRFIDSLLNGTLALGNKTTKAALAEMQTQIKNTIEDTVKATGNVAIALKDTLTASNQLGQANQQLVFNSLYIDPTKALSIPAKRDSKLAADTSIKTFTSAQKRLKLPSISEKEKLDNQNQIVKSALNLQDVTDTTFANSITTYQKAQKKRDAARATLNNEQSVLKSKKEYLATLKTEFASAIRDYTITNLQDSNPKEDNNAYRRTKAQNGDPADIAPSASSQYAVFDGLEYLDMWANDWPFYISAKDFSDNAQSIFPSSTKFTWGFLTLPLKIRFDNKNDGGRFNFEQNLNFGLTAGFKHQLVRNSDVSWNYLAGISVVNVPLNNAVTGSTTTTITDGSQNTTTTPGSTATSTAAVSTSVGVMFQYDKFQIGTFLGKDFAGDHANQFPYQHKVWLGFAIGLSLFGEGKTTAGGQSQ